MQDYYGGSLDGATDRYTEDCAKVEDLHDVHLCDICHYEVLPRTAIKYPRIHYKDILGQNYTLEWIYIHHSCIEEAEEYEEEDE